MLIQHGHSVRPDWLCIAEPKKTFGYDSRFVLDFFELGFCACTCKFYSTSCVMEWDFEVENGTALSRQTRERLASYLFFRGERLTRIHDPRRKTKEKPKSRGLRGESRLLWIPGRISCCSELPLDYALKAVKQLRIMRKIEKRSISTSSIVSYTRVNLPCHSLAVEGSYRSPWGSELRSIHYFIREVNDNSLTLPFRGDASIYLFIFIY